MKTFLLHRGGGGQWRECEIKLTCPGPTLPLSLEWGHETKDSQPEDFYLIMTALLPLSIHLQGMAPASSAGWISLLTPTVSLLTGGWGRGTWDSFTDDFMTKSFMSYVLHIFSQQGELTKSNIFTIVLPLSGWRVLSPSYILLRIFSLTLILRKGSISFLYAWKLNWLSQSMFLSPTEQAHKVGPHGEVQKKTILRMSIPVLTFLVLLSSN
jgi:hypothetical protein